MEPDSKLLSYILATSLAVLFVALMAFRRSRESEVWRRALLDRLPILDASGKDLLAATHEGYLQYLKKDLPYRLRIEPTGAHDRVMLPFKYLREIVESPESDLSFYLSSEIDSMLKYTGCPAQTPSLTHTAKTSLNRNLTRLIPLIHRGLVTNIADALPQTEQWSSIPLFSTMLNLVGRNSARVIGAPALSDNDEWVLLSTSFTEHVFAAAHSTRTNFGAATLWLAKWIDNPSRAILKCRRRAAQILEPLYHEHRDRLSSRDAESVKYTTGIDWLQSTPQRRESSLQELTDDMLLLSLAAIHTTTLTLTAMIRDLVMRPELCRSLRKEVFENVPPDGTWTAPRLAKLPLLDSFMKESQRVNFIVLNTILRAPYKDYRFSDGLVLPAQTICQMAAHELNMDPDIYPEPENFDPMRFYNLNKATGTNNYSFTSIATDRSLTFGAGSNTCPGRQLASATMKMILSELLMNYDLKWEDGKAPPSIISSGGTRMVDPTATLLFRQARSETAK